MRRSEAWALLTEWTKGDALLRHALSVEAAMRSYARRFGEDEELWGIAGLLHDFDYERHPTLDLHPQAGASILRAHGVPESVVYAIQAHAEHLNLPRQSLMDRTLFAVDELCGFVGAVALVRPTRTVIDLEVSSVRKKMKDRAFARAIRREDIVNGAASLEIRLDDHIAIVIASQRTIAERLEPSSG